MTRPHIMFIQAQALKWRRGLAGRPGVQVKFLSVDKRNGDSTCLIRYPAGWSRRANEHVRANEEFFVLEGSIKVNGIAYGQHGYAFLPAGHPRKSASSKDGAVLLTTFSATPIVEAGAAEHGLYDKKLLIEHKNTLEMAWDPGLVDPKLAKGTMIKPLRTDPYTGEASFLYSTAAHRIPKNMEKPKWGHTMVEELYVIDGEYVWGDCGVMGPGGYAWWREDEWHGPSGSITGFNLWVRTVNGPMENLFTDKPIRMNWSPKYRPKLPKELKQLAKPYLRRPNY